MLPEKGAGGPDYASLPATRPPPGEHAKFRPSRPRIESTAMKLTMLGTGGAFTRLRSNPHNNALIEIDGKRFLLDCSLYAFDVLDSDYDLDPLDLDGVLITHFHGDHISGLEELGFRSLFLGDRRPVLYCHPHLVPGITGVPDEGTLDLWENCLRGAMENMRDVGGNEERATLETYFEPRPAEEFFLGDDDRIQCTWFSTDHAPGMPSFGLAFENDEGRRLCYTADSRLKSVEFYRTFDVILHDCLLLPRFPGTVHAHLEELLDLPKDVQQRIHIMHYGDIDEARQATGELSLQMTQPGSSFEL
jgi:ribonuclease BN (tRNA processing enzyme)